MTYSFADRVKETTVTTGTGTVTLDGATTGFRSFSVFTSGTAEIPYCISSSGGSEWEVGLGTYTSSGTTLSRDTVLASSNSGSLVDFSAGSKDVFVTFPAARAEGSRVAQIATYKTGAVATGTTIIPDDDTIPQNTEGTEFLAVSITPRNAASTLKIEVTLNVAISTTNSHIFAAVFKDSDASAIAASAQLAPTFANVHNRMTFAFDVAAGSTSSRTYKVRAGAGSAATITLNGFGGARKLGGVMYSAISVTEILP